MAKLLKSHFSAFYNVEFYHPNTCMFCKATSNLKICTKCKSVLYCSKEHQINDWPKHQILCKVICAFDQEFSLEKHHLGNNKSINLNIIGTILNKMMRRDLLFWISTIITYRRACIVCNSRFCTLQCKNCLSIFYCSTDHKSKYAKIHSLHCHDTKVWFQLLLYNYKMITKCVPIFSKKIVPPQALPESIEGLMQSLVEECYICIPKDLNFFDQLLLKDSFSPIANILFGLEKTDLLENGFFIKEALCIHIVGAAFEESSWNWSFIVEFIFHWIKNIKNVVFIAIGPDTYSSTFSSMSLISNLCSTCKSREYYIEYITKIKEYHEVVDEVRKPDIIMAYNCSFHSLPTWHNSISSLTKYSAVPVVITDLTLMDVKLDIQVVMDYTPNEVEIVLNPKRNLFSYLSPSRGLGDEPICYKNGFISIFKAK